MSSADATVTGHLLLFVQLNDLYQIDTSSDYTHEDALILPRISTLVSDLRKTFGDHRVRFCVPGDFLAPSCLSKEFKGAQMIDVLNLMSVDYVSLGNHEFDGIDAAAFEARVRESRFKWLNLNFEFKDPDLQGRLEQAGKMAGFDFIPISESHSAAIFGVLNVKDTPSHLGTVHDNTAEILEGMLAAIDAAKERGLQRDSSRKVDFTFVAMTHQKLDDDLGLPDKCSGLDLIMGGHDHNVTKEYWENRCVIVKTASNARSLRLNWIVVIPRHIPGGEAPPDMHAEPERFRKFGMNVMAKSAIEPVRDALLPTRKLSAQQYTDILEVFDTETQRIRARIDGDNIVFVFSMSLNTQSSAFRRLVAPDSVVQTRIRDWNARCAHPNTRLAVAPEELILEDRIVRRFSTNFGNFVADLFRGFPVSHPKVLEEADVGLVNSGSFRIDRNIQKAETISLRTLCNIFYHPNQINLYRISGSALLSVLEQSYALRSADPDEGDGDFLQIAGIKVVVDKASRITVERVSAFGKLSPLDPACDLTIATTSYVASRAYKNHFKSPPIRELHKDVSRCVSETLNGMDESLFSIYLSNDPRWIFEV